MLLELPRLATVEPADRDGTPVCKEFEQILTICTSLMWI